jgi:heat-inducible transcriptional repressor
VTRGGEIAAKTRGQLTERQQAVLRAIVAAYVGGGSPVGSTTLTHLLPVKLSPASIRSTMAELTELGFLEQTHVSSGRQPTARGLRVFVDRLLRRTQLGVYDRRSLEQSLEEVEGDGAIRVTSQLLSEHSGLLGFVVGPRLEKLVLQHVSFVRLSTERLLVVMISRTGQSHQRVIDDPGSGDQAELERIAVYLNERLAGHTLPEIRELLSHDLERLRSQASGLVRRALALGLRALEQPVDEEADLVIATRLALLDQPEFEDPGRVRELFAALGTRGRLLEVLDRVLAEEVSVAFGDELEEPALRHCALVVAPYGKEVPPLGALGVIGPSRIDFGRVIPLVSYCSQLITEKLNA